MKGKSCYMTLSHFTELSKTCNVIWTVEVKLYKEYLVLSYYNKLYIQIVIKFFKNYTAKLENDGVLFHGSTLSHFSER